MIRPGSPRSTESRVSVTIPKLHPEIHRALGAALFNRTWDLLATGDRTATQDDDLVATAHV
jgi:hypothetical protein